MNLKKLSAILALALGISAAANSTEIDADVLGKSEGYPVARLLAPMMSDKYIVGTFSNLPSVLAHRAIKTGGTASALPAGGALPAVTYAFDDKQRNVSDYLANNRITGLMIVRDGKVLLEKYQYDRKPEHLFTSNSMAKSVVSLAIGCALQDGSIRSLDDPAALYAPQLKNHPYGETSIRDLLRMSSGVKFNEMYESASDIQTFAATALMASVNTAINRFREREVGPGYRFSYASIESAVLGLVVRGATGQSLADYVSERIWKPLGAEGDAAWNIDPKGVEIGFAYFNARLRDYARLGAMLANDGKWNNRQIIPADYLREATDWHAQPEHFAPGKVRDSFGYGYHFWTLSGEARQFALIGIHGQLILVHPAKRLVLVQTAVTKTPRVTSGPHSIWPELSQLWQALVAATPDV